MAVSKQGALAFIRRILTEEAFQQRVSAEIEGKEGAAAIDALIRAGSREGFEVTADELRTIQAVLTTKGELREERLADVTGGMRGFDGSIGSLKDRLNTIGDDAQLANVDLQNVLQQVQQYLQMLSNVSKSSHDNAMSIIRRIGG
jgi:hypothetical protein